MTDPLTKHVRDTLKAYGDQAPAHFGVKKATLDGYIKRGKYPLSLISKIIGEQQAMADAPPEVGPPPPPEPRPQPRPATRPTPPPQPETWDAGQALTATNQRVQQIVDYIQQTVDVYIKQFSSRIDLLEKHLAFVRANQMRAAVGAASLTRPDQMAPVDQVFTTNPNTGVGGPIGNNWDTGVGPTKEAVDAQASVPIIEGVQVRGAELARPATFFPEQPAFGFGWNIPRQRK
jgi:hypothetical protein